MLIGICTQSEGFKVPTKNDVAILHLMSSYVVACDSFGIDSDSDEGVSNHCFDGIVAGTFLTQIVIWIWIPAWSISQLNWNSSRTCLIVMMMMGETML